MSNANRMRNALPDAQPQALPDAVRSAMPTAMHERNGLTKNYHYNSVVEVALRTAHARTQNPLFSLPFVVRYALRPAVIHRLGATMNPDDPRVRRDHRAEQDAADRPWWRRVWLTLLAWIGGAR